MLIISNTSTQPMPLGMESVQFIIQNFDRISVLGNLRTWSQIDHFDPNSPLHCKSESQFSKLKQTILQNNWDLDLDLENIDFLYE